MTIPAAIRDGLRRVKAGPQLIIFLWLVNCAVAFPLALVMADQIQSAIGASLVHEKLRRGFDIDWYEEFNYEARGLTKTFSPTVIGVGPFIANLEAWLDGGLFKNPLEIVGLGVAFIVIWMFLLGGVLDHFARRGAGFARERFFSAAGRYFPRFLRLAALAGVLYFLIYALILPRMFSLITNAARDIAAERPIFFLNAAAYLIALFPLVLVNMAFDYAKISTVLNERRSMIAAALHGFHFVWSHPGRTFGLYCALGVILLLFLGIYSLIAPGAGQSHVLTVILAFLIGQAYLVIKLILRLTFLAGQMALYQSISTTVDKPAKTTLAESGLSGRETE